MFKEEVENSVDRKFFMQLILLLIILLLMSWPRLSGLPAGRPIGW